jgi:hypothetical protein
MLVLEILLTALVLPVIIYQILNVYYRRSLADWLDKISLKYGIHSKEVIFFHRKLIAIDQQRDVVVFLDEEGDKEEGTMIGLAEIENCELVVHEVNNEGRKKDIDRIELELQLKTTGKITRILLYEKSFFAALNKTKLQLKAVDCYEQISAIAEKNTELVSRIA